jgi:nitrogen fixation NifU-like protein
LSSVYSERIIEHYKNPRNYGRLEDAHLFAKESNVICGDEVSVYLVLDDSGRVSKASFEGESCILCKASASILTEYIKGKTKEEILGIGHREVVELLGLPGLKGARLNCALLPMKAIKSALATSKR